MAGIGFELRRLLRKNTLLGLVDYATTAAAMQAFTEQRGPDTADALWICEHPPVYTQGLAGKADHLLNPGTIAVVQTNRGGQVTYHGPGQIVAYPLFDLKRMKTGVREYVCRIEQSMIDTMAEWNIHAERKQGAPGVYVAGAKVGALGIRVRRGCTFHGLAFNIDMDLEPWHRINPCGYQGLQVTTLADLGGPSGMEPVKPVLLAHLAKQFGLELQTAAELPDLSLAA